ncbi:PREDICTED: LOW QUALITY PROTEIN: unconventional myosin-VIIb [Myotis davidii]|uniref:LOW QUALITY PROTEIN: unconventional myosin-VIIb n=1 Tax=Myotis davidii TaxID=225400 RepID=UPI000767A75D|nr:PREDICTED: LOW QUALITY PROTEIN: unconventional myosin-VIIb [Myotis davidii]
MSAFRLGDHVWLNPTSASKTNIAIGGVIKETKPGRTLVEDDEGKEHWVQAENLGTLSPMHPNSAEGVDDMIHLGDLNEAGMVHNLLIRYQQHKIYTYMGSILVAVNPFQVLPLYTREQVQLYYSCHMGELPPHVFAIANSCYFNMKRNKRDQCCIISGESGAGKTETTKLVLQFLATVSGQHSWIEQQVLEANPILEAFGNAKTIRNDNSSRFGKYIDIYFNPSGVIESARIEQFLLEKSRVCRQGNCTSCEGLDDAKDYAHVRSALKILMFSDAEHWDLSKLLAAILHLGNVEFTAAVFENLDSSDVMETPAFPTVATFLEVTQQALRDCLVKHSIAIRGELVARPLSTTQAADRRDALVKGIYGHLFLWIVKKINAAIFTAPTQDPKHVRRAIGLLDIFGFENFQNNSFEQLCINFANEHLQQFFVQHVFTQEQEEYHSEGVAWDFVGYTDNRPTLDLLALKPMSIISLLDEESRLPQGTDATMLQKLNSVHANNKAFLQPKNIHDARFGVAHFAGEVYYRAEGFLEKNRDVLSTDILTLVHSSQNKFLREIFKLESADIKLGRGTIRRGQAGSQVLKSADSSRQPATLAGQFKQSLDQLMKILTNCQPSFIRCIKPNEHKKPLLFDRELCLQQLPSSGLRDKCRQMTLRIADTWLGTDRDWKVGKTKIFLKEHQDALLEVQRSQALETAAVSIQRVLRGYKHRREFLQQRQAAVSLQAAWRGRRARQSCRGYLVRQQVQARRRAVVVIQAHARGMAARRNFRQQKANVGGHCLCEQGLPATTNQQPGPRAPAARKRKSIYDTVTDTQMVEQVFGFLPSMIGGQEGQAPSRFEDLETKTQQLPEVDLDAVPALDEPEDDRDGLAEYSFPKFAATYFQKSASHTHMRKPLRYPLLYHEDDADCSVNSALLRRLGARGLSLRCGSEQRAGAGPILRFMGDLPEPVLFARTRPAQDAAGREGSARPPQHGSAQRPSLRDRRTKDISSMKLKRSSQITGQVASQLNIGEEAFESEGSLSDRPMSNLEKVHFIVSHALLQSSLRSVPLSPHTMASAARLAERILCTRVAGATPGQGTRLGCRFRPPSGHVRKYLLNFIGEGPAGYGPFCAERLRRTYANGVRTEPPTWLELQAVKSRKHIPVHVVLATGQSLTVTVDSASTSQEVCLHIARQQGLRDHLGFSLQVAVYDKFWSLGSGRDHVMDAIGQCEQLARERGESERQSPWRLYFRKEFFSPWHDPQEDAVSTELIYRQVLHGVWSGEYSFEREEELVELLARHCYVQLGTSVGREAVQALLPSCVPPKLYRTKTPEQWAGLVAAALAQGVLQGWVGRAEEAFGHGVLTLREARGGQRLLLSTLHEEEYEFVSPSSVAIAELVAVFLEGLKERSVFAMALEDQKATGDAALLPFKKGDLLILTKSQGRLAAEDWVQGQNDRTGRTGQVLAACPSLFSLTAARILRYMGDYPSRQAWASLELTDQIFAGALQEAALQDEVYCQILKQLTHNTKRYSEERGWQLLWLCTGLFPPGKALLPHVQKFLDTRRGRVQPPLCPSCSRMGPRKQPPHQVEVEAAEQNVSRICHKVFLPNHTSQMLEVGAHTRVRDVCAGVASKLQLASWEGCSLFIKIADKVISQKEGDFFFDSLRQVSDWVKKSKPQKEGAPLTLPYQVYFMRKLWLGVAPGKDMNADTVLHYHQELPKYLRGFHKCSREDAVQLAGLICKAQFDSDPAQLASIPKVLGELVPENLTRLMSPEEWRKSILLAYDQHRDKTVEEAKVAFLKWICRWPTFGSAFFEVKQTSEPSYPDIILIAINRHGVLLIHPKSKELLTTYPFTKIASWSSGSTYFHMVLGSLGRGSRLLCETSLGYKMDDLLTSYVQQLLSAVAKQRGPASAPARP